MKQIMGVLGFLGIALNLTFFIPWIVLGAILKKAIPVDGVQQGILSFMNMVARWAIHVDSWMLHTFLGLSIEMHGQEKLQPNSWYVCVCNHQSWADILLLQYVFSRTKLPIKFMVKQEILWVPVVGWICWAYEYPFLKRKQKASSKGESKRQKHNLQMLESSCEQLRRKPGVLINFAEGTRLTPAKHQKMNSSYQDLLPPRAKGLTLILSTMQDYLTGVVDVTLAYEHSEVNFWKLLSFQHPRVKIEIEVQEVSEIASDLSSSENVESWLQSRWKQKEQKLLEIRASA